MNVGDGEVFEVVGLMVEFHSDHDSDELVKRE